LPKVVRINLDDPERMAAMLRSGAIWQLPQFWQKAVKAIESGLVPLAECKNVPAEVMKGMQQ
jgi:hypothetical protein